MDGVEDASHQDQTEDFTIVITKESMVFLEGLACLDGLVYLENPVCLDSLECLECLE